MKSVVIITSVIHFDDKELSYSKIRSIYTPEERTEQTIKTINSVKDKLPNSEIILVELGNQKIDKLTGHCTTLYLGNNRFVKWCVQSKNKSLGEVCGLLIFAINNYKLISDKKIFKLSGRYTLNMNFNSQNYCSNNFLFKKYSDSVSTRLYHVGTNLNAWISILTLSLPFLFFGRSVEDTFCIIFNFFSYSIKVSYIKTLGVEGLVGVDGFQIIE